METNRIVLLPIGMNERYNSLTNFEEFADLHQMTIDFYLRVGYLTPWVGYYAVIDKEIVGACGFKGAPRNGTIEISYGTLKKYERLGIATEVCRQMTQLALREDPEIRITARTLPENNASARLLQKNGFKFNGEVEDEDDGNVLEWEYVRQTNTDGSAS